MLRQFCACDELGFCPYDGENCEMYCSEPEPQDDPEIWDDDDDEWWYDDEMDSELEEGFDPYLGCYTEDC